MEILKKDYSTKRFTRKLYFAIARSSFIPGEWRSRIAARAGIGFDDPKSNFIGSNVKFDDLYPEGIFIGRNSIIAADTLIMTHYLDTTFDDFDHQIIGQVSIGSDVFIGAKSIIVKPIKIGKGSIVAAGSVCTNDIGEYEIWGGVPAVFIKKRKIKKK